MSLSKALITSTAIASKFHPSSSIPSKKSLIRSPKAIWPFGHSFLVFKPGGFRRALQEIGHLYEKLGSNTIEMQPLPNFMHSVVPEVRKIVYTKDEHFIKYVLQTEDKYPRRAGYLNENMQQIQKELGVGNDIVSTDGEEWSNHRKMIQKPLSTPSEVEKFAPDISLITREYIELLKNITSKNGGFVDDLKFRNTTYSFEVITRIIYGSRSHVLKEEAINQSSFREYSESFVKLFDTFAPLSFCPVKVVKSFGYFIWWKKAKQFYHKSLVQSRKLADHAAENSKSSCVWSNLVGKVPDKEALKSNLTAVLSGALDTTATQLIWIIQVLAEHPDMQQRLFEDIRNQIGEDPLTYENIHRMNLARAIIKEVQRLYPLVGFFPRQPYKDINYTEQHTGNTISIEKGTIIFIDNFNYGRDPQYFEEPLEFRPERWMRDSPDSLYDKNRLFLTFGSGSRSCIGRRISELEMKMFVIELIRHFKLDLNSPGCYMAKPVYSGVVIPDKVPRVRFVERS